MRPFVLGAKVSPLGCSRPLQRAIVDFAADQPFAQARAKLEEHYGFAIGESTIQRITFAHAQAMQNVLVIIRGDDDPSRNTRDLGGKSRRIEWKKQQSTFEQRSI